jgi:hypothetical protein
MAETGHHPKRAYFDQQGNFHPDATSKGFAVLATITPAAGSANVSLVSIQLTDASGANLAVVVPVDVWLSDAATGIGLTGTTASGAVAAGTSGTDLGVLTTKKANRSITDATGLYILSITDSAKTGFFVCCSIPGSGEIFVSAALTAGNFG